MTKKWCKFCGTRGDFAGCACKYRDVLGCASKATCTDCEKAHKKVFGPFFCTLLASRPATRSNSPRTRLLEILHSTLCYFGNEEIREKSYCLDMLRATSAFDEDAANFRGRVLDVASAIPLKAQVAKTISAKIADAGIVRTIEQLEIFLRESGEKEKLTNALARFVQATGVIPRDLEASRRGSCVRETPTSRDFYR
jgi:hypothetical protein